MNTKQAKDFLVQQTAEQAALESLSLSDIEKRMMYFTESDPSSCADPFELNDEFEEHCDTPEYEAKIGRLLRHSYNRLKLEDPERKRVWNQAVGELRKGDHYFLVLWDLRAPTEHSTRDSLKLVGIGLLIAAGIGIAIALAVKYNIDLDRYGKFVPFVVVGVVFLASPLPRALYRLAVVWFHHGTTGNE